MSFSSISLVSNAHASDVAAAPQSGLASFVPLIFIFIIFYFLLIRPQQKKAKEHQNLINDLKAGNKVCTSAGIYGVVKKVDKESNIVDLEVANDVVISILRQSITEVVKVEKKNSNIINQNKKSKKTNKK